MNRIKPLIVLLGLTAASPLWAGHANPWATSEDTLVMQYHEDNLAQSADTPLEDAMLGSMVRSARGKLEIDAGQDDGDSRTSGRAGGGAQGGGSGGEP